MSAIIQSRIICALICNIESMKIKIYRTVIIPAVLPGCGTWYITLREQHRLRRFTLHTAHHVNFMLFIPCISLQFIF
jgi:hypothetical protein